MGVFGGVPNATPDDKGIAFLFTGHGTQWPFMGKRLVEDWPAFKATILKCDNYLGTLPESDRPPYKLMDELTHPHDLVKVNQVLFSQPLCMAVQLGLVDLWHSWDLSPTIVVGHSTGEIPAAYAAGILSLRDAIVIGYYVAFCVSRELQNMSAKGQHGAMCAIGLHRQAALQLIQRFENKIALAAENASFNCTLSGDSGTIDQIISESETSGTFCRRLQVDGAYHSPHMRVPARHYAQCIAAAKVSASDPVCEMLSCLDARPLTKERCTPLYWERSLNETVEFREILTALMRRPFPLTAILDLSPQPIMKVLVQESIEAHSLQTSYFVSSSKDLKHSQVTLQSAQYLQQIGVKLRHPEALVHSQQTLNSSRKGPTNDEEQEFGTRATVEDHTSLQTRIKVNIRDAVVDQLSATCGFDRDIPLDTPLSACGMDSGGAVLFRKWLYDELELDISVVDLLSDGTPDRLISDVQKRILRPSLSSSFGLPVPTRHKDLSFRPCSSSQRRMWFLESLIPQHTLNNLLVVCKIVGDLDIEAFHQSWDIFYGRHEVLSSSFADAQQDLQQIPNHVSSFNFSMIEADNSGAIDPLGHLCTTLLNHEFKIDKGETILGRLLNTQTGLYFLLASHHIAWDGTSQATAFREVGQIYRAIRRKDISGRSVRRTEPVYQFVDYAIWQNELVRDAKLLQPHLSYWRQKLSGAPLSISLLPNARSSVRPPVKRHEVGKAEFEIDTQTKDAISAVCKRYAATPFMFFAAAFASTYHRLSGDKDIIIGTADGDRGHPAFEGLVGFAVNMLSIRCQIADSSSFADIFKTIRQSTLEAFEHRLVPFDMVVSELAVPRKQSHDALFQVAINYLNDGVHPRYPFEGVELTDWVQHNVRMQGDLLIEIENTREGGIKGSFQFDTSLYDLVATQDTIQALLTMVKGVLSDTEQDLSRISLLSLPDARLVASRLRPEALSSLCLTQSDLFPELLALTARQFQKKTAFEYEDQTISFEELIIHTNKIANSLLQRGTMVGDSVLLYSEQNLMMVIGMLGIMKAGAAYCPISADLPEERVASILADVDAHCALIDLSERASSLISCGLNSEDILTIESTILHANSAIPTLQRRILPSDPIIAVFTSGSTGRPKGLFVRHGSLRNQIRAHMEYVGLSSADRIILASSMMFDMHTVAVFASLMYGCTACIASSEVRLNPSGMIDFVVSRNVSACTITPTQLEAMFAAPNSSLLTQWKSLRIMTLGGEPVSPDLLRRFHQLCLRHAVLSNAYGPSETTNAVSIQKYFKGDEKVKRLSLGGALAPARLYVLDKNRMDAPIGFPGELWIGGMTVNPDYIQRPKETAESFRLDFHAAPSERSAGWGVLYKTGDRFCFRRDGQLEFVGRVEGDRQVKIRGIRTELREIENVMLSIAKEYDESKQLRDQANITAAAVVLHKNINGTEEGPLVGYMTTKGGRGMSQGVQRQLSTYFRVVMKARLPPHMIPSVFQYLESFPQLTSGKIDYGELATRVFQDIKEADELTDKHAPALNYAQTVVAGVWRDVVERCPKSLQPDDDFFVLGGHSLLLPRVQRRIEQKTGVVIPVARLFKAQTLDGVAKLLQAGFSSARREMKL